MTPARMQTTISQQSQAARGVAPEDLQRGEFVAVLDAVVEWPSHYWAAADTALPPGEPVRVLAKSQLGGVPLKVRSICLPFVHVKTPAGKIRVLDVRTYRLARLSRDYARRVWRALKRQQKDNRK